MKAGKNCVVVSWCSRDVDPYPRSWETGIVLPAAREDPVTWGPVLRVLTDPASDLKGRVSDWYYLCHPVSFASGKRQTARTAMEVAEETRAALVERLESSERPRFLPRTWVTSRPPNDYADLYAAAANELRQVRAAHPRDEIVLVVSSGTPEMQGALLLAGSVGVISGPLRLVQVERNEGARKRPGRTVFDVALEIPSILRVARETTPVHFLPEDSSPSGYDQARSAALRASIEEARAAARVRFPVLLRGERGAGKSMLARFIRAMSPFRQKRRDQEWPAIACGQFASPERVLIELCGSVEGAFTGAKRKDGLLAMAHGDTLFLDEIHDLTHDCQRVLIRTLEDGAYYPVGSEKPSRSEFRLISGTNLEDRVLVERLAPDFFDRIRDIELRVPPLRECREDLGWMWDEKWREIAARAGTPVQIASPHRQRIVDTLERAELPGNWRDLRRLAIQLSIASTSGRTLSEAHVRNALESLVPRVRVAHSGIRPAAAMSKADARYRKMLEVHLGPDLATFWARRDAGESPKRILEELLGDRHKARRAEAFIGRHFPGD